MLVAAILVAIGVLGLTFSGLVGQRRPVATEADFEPYGVAFERVEFADLEGWHRDNVDESLPPFLRSCERILALEADAPANPYEWLGADSPGELLAGRAGDWRVPCEEAARLISQRYADESAKSSAVKSFYEYHFSPVRLYERLRPKPGGRAAGLAGRLNSVGRFTGYFEPNYEASASRTAAFSAPVYARPDDLVTVDLGLFRPELGGQRIAGRLDGGALNPYQDHAAINGGAIAGRARVLAWMRPTDLFFLQIQGSGRLMLPEGEIRVGYDGANGRPYTAVGRTLIEMGAMTPEAVSMKTIKDWLEKAKDADARAVREANQSFVFFRVLDALPDEDLGPPGAEGTQLTPQRSLAVDPRYVAYGAPVWVSIDGRPEQFKEPFRRMMIAQDAGGAIKGPLRGDIFFGSGPKAGDIAGGFNELGEMHILLPRKLAERLPEKARP